jgi:hypothetical protein
MGYYINPQDMTKEKWLSINGKPSAQPKPDFDFAGDTLPVCLVDNGWMNAAGICYSARELEAFTEPTDRRPKLWFLVAKDLLAPYLEGHK